MAVRYFSEQHNVRRRYELPELRKQLQSTYKYFLGKKYLAEVLGYACVDGYDSDDFGMRWVFGIAGEDIGGYVFAETGRPDIWPLDPVDDEWSEDQVFDTFQFLGNIVSKPIGGWEHQHAGCGLHPREFDRKTGLDEYRSAVNRGLARYGTGWEIQTDLYIAELPPNGMATLVTAPVPKLIDPDSRRRIEAAIEKYRRRASTREDRRDAVRGLGDVFERYRAQAKSVLGKTESDLFNVLNNFDIRHNNELQKTDYDPIFMSGLFYHYLNMVHVFARLLERQEGRDQMRAEA